MLYIDKYSRIREQGMMVYTVTKEETRVRRKFSLISHCLNNKCTKFDFSQDISWYFKCTLKKK